MNVTRIGQAPPYYPPAHDDMRCLRLQGHEAGPSSAMWMGLSHLLPGGRTSLQASPLEKLYVVLEGEVVVSTGTEEVVLKRWTLVGSSPEKHGLYAIKRTRPPAFCL